MVSDHRRAAQGHDSIRPSKRDVVAEFRRGEILDAARRVFAERGFAAATVDEIARQAGMAKGTIYLYYRSKTDVYSGAALEGLRDLHEQVMAGVRSADTPYEKVRAFIEIKARYFERHVDFFRLYYAELHELAADTCGVHVEMQRLYLEQVSLLESELQRGFPDRTDLHSVALAIGALTYGIITRRLRGWSASSLEDDIESVVRFAWLGVAGR
jgi:TetR/AcrR family fatty acid metabolism transcriptional regulator